MAGEQKPPQPSAEDMQRDMQKSQQVATAGVEAEQAGRDPKEAMRQEAERVQLDIPDDVMDKFANMVKSKTIEELEERGAFAEIPEPVTGPEHTESTREHPADARQAEQPPAQTDEPAPAPQRRTWAQRFLGA